MSKRAAEVERRYVNDLPSRKVIFVVLFVIGLLWLVTRTAPASFSIWERDPNRCRLVSFSFLQIVDIRRLIKAT